MSPRPWWIAGEPCDEAEPVECQACAGMGADDDGDVCPWCDGSGEVTGGAGLHGRGTDDLEAWHARMDALDREALP